MVLTQFLHTNACHNTSGFKSTTIPFFLSSHHISIINNDLKPHFGAWVTRSVQRQDMGWTADLRQRKETFFIFSRASGLAMRPTQPIQWAPRVISPGVKGPRYEADLYLAQRSRMVTLYLHFLLSLRGGVLIKHRDFTFLPNFTAQQTQLNQSCSITNSQFTCAV
jgi:hypothetical protein